jgi:type III secretion system chaperone SycN
MTALLDDIINQFGRSIGIEDLALRENGSVVLDMQQMGKLSFELIGERREEISVSLTRRVDFDDSRAPAKLMELCHYRNAPPFAVRAGLTSAGDLTFAVGMESSDFTLPNLNTAIETLIAFHQQSEAFVSLSRNS